MEDQVKENKGFQSPSNKKVKVMINKNRAMAGIGKAGDVVEMTEALAKQYESDGYVTILEMEKK